MLSRMLKLFLGDLWEISRYIFMLSHGTPPVQIFPISTSRSSILDFFWISARIFLAFLQVILELYAKFSIINFLILEISSRAVFEICSVVPSRIYLDVLFKFFQNFHQELLFMQKLILEFHLLLGLLRTFFKDFIKHSFRVSSKSSFWRNSWDLSKNLRVLFSIRVGVSSGTSVLNTSKSFFYIFSTIIFGIFPVFITVFPAKVPSENLPGFYSLEEDDRLHFIKPSCQSDTRTCCMCRTRNKIFTFMIVSCRVFTRVYEVF